MTKDGFVWPQTHANDPGSLVGLPFVLLGLIPIAHPLAVCTSHA